MQKEQRQLCIKWEHQAGKNPVREMPSVKLYPLHPTGFSQNPVMHPSAGYQALLQVRALCLWNVIHVEHTWKVDKTIEAVCFNRSLWATSTLEPGAFWTANEQRWRMSLGMELKEQFIVSEGVQGQKQNWVEGTGLNRWPLSHSHSEVGLRVKAQWE